MKKILAILILAYPIVAFAGGWTEQKRQGYFKISQSWLKANAYYTRDGERIPIRTLGTYTTSLYARYGITNKWTVFTYVPFFMRNTLNKTVGRTSGETLQQGASKNAFGDMSVGVQYGILQKKGFALSSSLLLGLPTGSTNDPNGLFTGDGEFNQMLQVDLGYGKSVKKHTFYGNIYGAFNHRTNGFSEEVRFGAEAGMVLWQQLFIAFKMDGVQSLQNDDGGQSGVGLFANNTEFITYGPEVAYIYKNTVGVSFKYTTATLVRNTLASAFMEVGVFYKLNGFKTKKEKG